MAKLDPKQLLQINSNKTDKILQAGVRDDALQWLRDWQKQNGVGPNVKPLEEHIPMPYRIIIRKAELPTEDVQLAGLPRASGSGSLTNSEFAEGLKIINSSSPNEQIRNQRELLLIKQAMQGL